MLMRKTTLMGVSVLALLSCLLSAAQDSQSLGDAARQARQQKHQSQSATGDGQSPATVKTPHVVTNDEIPEHEEDTKSNSQPDATDAIEKGNVAKRPAEFWKGQILRIKGSVVALQGNIDRLSNSIHFAGGNYDKHVLWNERQREKQRQLENMKSQLDQLQKRLEDLQEAARRQGYGSSVWDP